MKSWNSKWDYLLCGLNITFSFIGALAGSLTTLLVGVGCAIWSWYVAEVKRHLEEAVLLKAHGVTLDEDNDNGENNEEDNQ